MKKLRNQRGEMLVESLISMLIIAMTGVMLAMAAAAALQANVQAAKALESSNASISGVTPGGTLTASLVPDMGDTISLGSVTVRETGGVYYYE